MLVLLPLQHVSFHTTGGGNLHFDSFFLKLCGEEKIVTPPLPPSLNWTVPVVIYIIVFVKYIYMGTVFPLFISVKLSLITNAETRVPLVVVQASFYLFFSVSLFKTLNDISALNSFCFFL